MDEQDVDRGHPEPREALVERAFDFAFDVAQFGRHDLDLGADDRLCTELFEHAAEIDFGFAFSVIGRGVEIVHAELERFRNSILLLLLGAQDHQSGVIAGAERDLGHLQAGVAQRTVFHCDLLRSRAGQPFSSVEVWTHGG